MHKRSADSVTRLRLNVFGRDIDLSLNPTDGILAGFDTPVYVARRNAGGENRFENINNVGFQIWLYIIADDFYKNTLKLTSILNLMLF